MATPAVGSAALLPHGAERIGCCEVFGRNSNNNVEIALGKIAGNRRCADMTNIGG